MGIVAKMGRLKIQHAQIAELKDEKFSEASSKFVLYMVTGYIYRNINCC